MNLSKSIQSLKVIQKELHAASYLLSSTFSLTKDAKVLLGVLQHLLTAQQGLVDILVGYVSNVPLGYIAKLHILEQQKMGNTVCSKEELLVLQDTYTLAQEHKNCPVEFIKQKNVVLCDETYAMTFIDVKKMARYVQVTQLLFKKVQLMVGCND